MVPKFVGVNVHFTTAQVKPPTLGRVPQTTQQDAYKHTIYDKQVLHYASDNSAWEMKKRQSNTTLYALHKIILVLALSVCSRIKYMLYVMFCYLVMSEECFLHVHHFMVMASALIVGQEGNFDRCSLIIFYLPLQ